VLAGGPEGVGDGFAETAPFDDVREGAGEEEGTESAKAEVPEHPIANTRPTRSKKWFFIRGKSIESLTIRYPGN
jgi:hypothetical protein